MKMLKRAIENSINKRSKEIDFWVGSLCVIIIERLKRATEKVIKKGSRERKIGRVAKKKKKQDETDKKIDSECN